MHYVIGDVHGQLVCLKALLQKINYNPDEDVLYFVGDYVDWGPESMGVVQYLMELQKNGDVNCCMGNHDFMFVEAAKDKWERERTLSGKTNYARNGGDETLKQFLALPCDEQERILEWFDSLEPFCTVTVNEQQYYITHSTPIYGNPNRKDILEDAIWDRIYNPEWNYLDDIEEYRNAVLVSGHTITKTYTINKYPHYINVDCGAKVIGHFLWTAENLAALRLEDGAEFYVFNDEDMEEDSRLENLKKTQENQ